MGSFDSQLLTLARALLAMKPLPELLCIPCQAKLRL